MAPLRVYQSEDGELWSFEIMQAVTRMVVNLRLGSLKRKRRREQVNFRGASDSGHRSSLSIPSEREKLAALRRYHDFGAV